MKKKGILLALTALFMVVLMASCDDRNPDTAILPAPSVKFQAVEQLGGTVFSIDVTNAKEAQYPFIYRIVVDYTITDSDGTVLFEKEAAGLDSVDGNPIGGVLENVSAGDELRCTVTFTYKDRTESTTVNDIVG